MLQPWSGYRWLVHLDRIRARIRTDKDETVIGCHTAQRVAAACERQSEFLARGDADRIAVAGYSVGLFEYIQLYDAGIAATVQHIKATCDCISDRYWLTFRDGANSAERPQHAGTVAATGVLR